MKRMLCLCVVGLMVLALAGCNAFQNNTQSSVQQSGQNTSSFNERGENPALDTSTQDGKENKQLTSVGAPPLSENLQLMYQGADEMVRAFTLCSFQVDTAQTVSLEGMEYNVIVDPRFPTYEKLEAYLAQYFTKGFIDETLLTKNGCVQKGADGKALAIAASGAEDITYAGHVFRIDTQTQEKIVFTATAYYAKDTYLEDYFFTTPANAGEFTTKEFTYQLDSTENGWRFSQFSFLRG